MEALEQMKRARNKYARKVDKAFCHNDLIDAALEYIGKLEDIIEQLANRTEALKELVA